MKKMPRNYLLIIDDAPLDVKLQVYFNSFDYEVLWFASLPAVKVFPQPPLALLINCTIIQKDLSLLKMLYQHYTVPIIVMSEKHNSKLCIRLLEMGADDFLLKPLSPRELHARIGAISRRILQTNLPSTEKEILLFSKWRLYPASRQIFHVQTEEELILSAREYDLLLAFVQRPHQVLSRDFLCKLHGQDANMVFDRRMDVQISRLRQKIEPNNQKFSLIKTVRNGGYVFSAEVQTVKEPNL